MKTKLLKLVYFASVLVGCGSDHGNIVNPSGSYITGVINSDANQFGLCVK